MPDILLVTDLPRVSDGVRAAVAGAEYRLAVTADPAGAAGLCLEQRPQVVLIDLQVGSMGGMAVARDIRAATRAAGVTAPATVILLDRAVDAFLARRAGADAWIRKPFAGFALRRLVDRLAAERVGAATAT
jgi:DNA-binding response OmpR family regulator